MFRMVSGQKIEMTTQEETEWAALQAIITRSMVDAERDRRLYGGIDFTVDGVLHTFQSDLISQQYVSAMASLARFAILGGAQAGDYRWHGGTTDFSWTVLDNSEVAMDAQEMAALGDAFADFINRQVKRAVAIKKLDPIPTDFTADSRWT